jgi:hypothetical protein
MCAHQSSEIFYPYKTGNGKVENTSNAYTSSNNTIQKKIMVSSAHANNIRIKFIMHLDGHLLISPQY